MQVIVKESGFYGGTWHDAKPHAVEMHEKIAKQFLPPHGHQLALPAAEPVAAKPAAKSASKTVGEPAAG